MSDLALAKQSTGVNMEITLKPRSKSNVLQTQTITVTTNKTEELWENLNKRVIEIMISSGLQSEEYGVSLFVGNVQLSANNLANNINGKDIVLYEIFKICDLVKNEMDQLADQLYQAKIHDFYLLKMTSMYNEGQGKRPGFVQGYVCIEMLCVCVWVCIGEIYVYRLLLSECRPIFKCEGTTTIAYCCCGQCQNKPQPSFIAADAIDTIDCEAIVKHIQENAPELHAKILYVREINNINNVLLYIYI